MINTPYSSGLMSQSFWFIEVKKVVQLLSQKKTKAEIKEICISQNLFGIPKEYRAQRIFGYIWNRVKDFDQELIDLFLSSDLYTQKLINLISIIKNDRLFFEFLFEVYRDKVLLGTPTLEMSDINTFFRNKETQSDAIEKWKDTTKRHLGNNYINFMTDANLLTVIDKNRTITPPILDKRLEEYLIRTNQKQIIKAITGVN